jgi:hypothetical protein
MSRIAVLITLTALLTVASAAGAPAASESSSTLRLTKTSPVTLRGVAFKPRERVTLTVLVDSTNTRRVRKLTTGPAGGFTASFPTLLGVDRCEISATAVGARGSRATLKTPQPQCRPRQGRSATLRVANTQPVTVAGSEFLAGEDVTVQATLDGEASVRRVRATRGGEFTLAFSGLTIVDRCNSDLYVRAIGSRGSEATAKIGPQPQCPPRLGTP